MTITEAILILTESHTVADAEAEDGFRTELATPEIFLGRRSGEYREAWKMLRAYKPPATRLPPIMDEFNAWLNSSDPTRAAFDDVFWQKRQQQQAEITHQQKLHEYQMLQNAAGASLAAQSWSSQHWADSRSYNQNPLLANPSPIHDAQLTQYQFGAMTICLNDQERKAAQAAFGTLPDPCRAYAARKYKMLMGSCAPESTPTKKVKA